MKIKILLLVIILISMFLPTINNNNVENNIYKSDNEYVDYDSVVTNLNDFYNNLSFKNLYIKETNKFLCAGATFACNDSDKYQNIGLINKKEFDLIGGVNSYLSTVTRYWTMTEKVNTAYNIKPNGAVVESIANTSGIRPTIYLKNNIKVTGSGAYNKPYTFSSLYAEVGDTFDYEFTGNVQTFLVPANGYYKIELWGAQGGGTYETTKGVSPGGKGGFTSGIIHLTSGQILYIYVGQAGPVFTLENIIDASFFAATWNGGGAGTQDTSEAILTGEHGFPGGGATDVRLVNGAWNDVANLRSRIMVAAGGGGGGWSGNGSSDLYYTNGGGAGGGLTGIGAPGVSSSTPGTQTSGYQFGIGEDGVFNVDGNNNGMGGGGSGYYGGRRGLAFVKPNSSGSGGSSFISGHSGCDAIDESGNHTGQPNHYSGYIFTNTIIINGDSEMTSPSGGTEIGHEGNGYARITIISLY